MKTLRFLVALSIFSAIAMAEVKAGEPLLIDVNDAATGGPTTAAPTVKASTTPVTSAVAPAISSSTSNASATQPGPAGNAGNENTAGHLNGIFHGASATGETLLVTPGGVQSSTTTTVRSGPALATTSVPPRPRHETPVNPAVASSATAPATPTAALAATPSTTTAQGSTANKTGKAEEKSDTRWGFLASHVLSIAAGLAVGAFLLHSFLWTLSLGAAGYLVGGYIYDQFKDSKGGVNGWAIAGAALAGAGAFVLGGAAGFSLFEKIILGLAGAAGGYLLTNEATKPIEEPAPEEKPKATT